MLNFCQTIRSNFDECSYKLFYDLMQYENKLTDVNKLSISHLI